MKILYKLLILLVILTAIPLGILGNLALNDIRGMEKTANSNINLIGLTAVDDSTEALNNLGKELIKHRAVDIAKQLEIFIEDNPNMTVAELQNDSRFREIAVQPVGESGYSAVTDVNTLVCRFHASAKVENLDLHLLAEKLPGFWGVMEATEGGHVSEGYYDWAEPDGSIKKKYMYIAIVDAHTADGVQFSVAATTYVDEFSSPIFATQKKIDNSIKSIIDTISFTAQKVKSNTLMLIATMVLLVVIIGFLFSKSITTPLISLSDAGQKVADGKLDTELPQIKSKDEIKELSDTMTLLVGAIKFLKKDKK